VVPVAWKRPREGGPSLPYADRAEAGRILATRVAELGLVDPVILALPRGGVPIGFEIARELSVPLDVLVTRKIGFPGQPELGVGAIAEGGEPVFDDRLLAQLGLTSADLAPTVAEERAELTRRVEAYRGNRALPTIEGRDVAIVDDGLATGGTARAALRAVRRSAPARLVLAVPVSAVETAELMRREADEVVVLATPAAFHAVGQWYRQFEQLSDQDVISLLEHPGLKQRGRVS
jgi:putative phosphoribosyl transferase